MRNINDNVVQGRLSENYLTWKFIAWNILDMKYLRFIICTTVWAKTRIKIAKQAITSAYLPMSQVGIILGEQIDLLTAVLLQLTLET